MMLHTRLVKMILGLVAFTTGSTAYVCADERHWIGFALVAVLGSLLSQYLLDLYFRVRMAEFEIEARKAYVATVWHGGEE